MSETKKLMQVKAPMSGVFYRKPSPEEGPYVEVGDGVKKKQVIGLLAAMRQKPLPFSESEQNLLEAVADYASISLVNARLFKAVEERARALESQSDDAPALALQALRAELHIPLEKALASFEVLSKMRLKKEQSEAMGQMQAALNDMLRAINQAEDIAARIPRRR